MKQCDNNNHNNLPLLNSTETMDWLKISRSTLNKIHNEGRLKRIEITPTLIRYEIGEINRFLENSSSKKEITDIKILQKQLVEIFDAYQRLENSINN